jgi:hypothetical protein
MPNVSLRRGPTSQSTAAKPCDPPSTPVQNRGAIKILAGEKNSGALHRGRKAARSPRRAYRVSLEIASVSPKPAKCIGGRRVLQKCQLGQQKVTTPPPPPNSPDQGAFEHVPTKSTSNTVTASQTYTWAPTSSKGSRLRIQHSFRTERIKAETRAAHKTPPNVIRIGVPPSPKTKMTGF